MINPLINGFSFVIGFLLALPSSFQAYFQFVLLAFVAFVSITLLYHIR